MLVRYLFYLSKFSKKGNFYINNLSDIDEHFLEITKFHHWVDTLWKDKLKWANWIFILVKIKIYKMATEYF